MMRSKGFMSVVSILSIYISRHSGKISTGIGAFGRWASGARTAQNVSSSLRLDSISHAGAMPTLWCICTSAVEAATTNWRIAAVDTLESSIDHSHVSMFANAVP